jgi:hypothetical protein
MVCFQTKNPNFGKFWRALDCIMLLYFMAIGNILLRFGKFYGHFVHFVFIWYTLPVFGIMSQKNLVTLLMTVTVIPKILGAMYLGSML